nr:PREDICTED: interleukin-17 receptor D-like isoform X2 [Latimeria chalumnae]XP_014353035.1 PREDICTED: interleukin-17 receptor D-like isoform X2 [Latimeria chalumnae]XP_014353036.1 PREDICTED: interleukin-17 receptor D-like isoform X2 [Latimeria chalumnae]|eukprot:XP_014353034.1 PREDICTED: interleukin-17 receptor D-like isoform X2 [Latimeria chalumnae]
MTAWRSDGTRAYTGFLIWVKDIGGSGVHSECKEVALREQLKPQPNLLFKVPFCLPVDTTYIVMVYGYPIPPGRENPNDIMTTVEYKARSCEEVSGQAFCTDCGNLKGDAKSKCLSNWKTQTITFAQESRTLIVTFDQAPDSYGFQEYFVAYQGSRLGIPKGWNKVNVTHRFNSKTKKLNVTLHNLNPGSAYRFLVFSDFKDAVQVEKTYTLKPVQEDASKFAILGGILTGILSAVLLTLFVLQKRRQEGKLASISSNEEDWNDTELDAALVTPHHVPKVFICYSTVEGERHIKVVLHFATYLQEHCGCQVVLDLWEHLKIAQEGYVTWLMHQIEHSDFILVVCSQGMKLLVDKKPPSQPHGLVQQNSFFETNGANTVMFAISLIAEKMCQAKMYSGNISKFITVVLEYSSVSDVPSSLGLASKYKLMEDFPKLFSHLHSLKLSRPGYNMMVENITKDSYYLARSGYGFCEAIKEMVSYTTANPDWMKKLPW